MMAWRKDDKQWLTRTGGRVIGHAGNRKNHCQLHCENGSAHVAAIGTLVIIRRAGTSLLKLSHHHHNHHHPVSPSASEGFHALPVQSHLA